MKSPKETISCRSELYVGEGAVRFAASVGDVTVFAIQQIAHLLQQATVLVYLRRECRGLPTQGLVGVERFVTGLRRYDAIAFEDEY